MDLTVSDEYIELLPSRLINPRSQESIDKDYNFEELFRKEEL